MHHTELITLSETVEKLLRENDMYKNSDEKLWCRVIMDVVGGTGILKAMSAYELLVKYSKEELPSYDSVSRVRRKLQNENKELRGEKYNARLKNVETVKETLGYKI